MALRSKENSKMFVDQGTPELILQIMKVHLKDFKVQVRLELLTFMQV